MKLSLVLIIYRSNSSIAQESSLFCENSLKNRNIKSHRIESDFDTNQLDRFFSNIASFPKGPVALSLKTNVPIVPTAMIKMSTGYKLYFHKPFYVPLFDNEATSIQQGLKTLSNSFEEILSMDINDWHSIQPVWTVEY